MARLLIIEDNVPLATLLSTAAMQRGHEVNAVHNGKAGLATAGWTPPDLAVVDLLLPDMRGALLLEQLRERGIPCIAMSGVFKGDRFAQDAVVRHGALEFFEKPFDLGALLDAVERHVGAPEVGFDIDLDEGGGEGESTGELAELQLELSEIVETQDAPDASFRNPETSSTDLGLKAALAAPELEEVVAEEVPDQAPPAGPSEPSEDDEASFADLGIDSPEREVAGADTPERASTGPDAPEGASAGPDASVDDEASFADLAFDASSGTHPAQPAPSADDEASFADLGFDAPVHADTSDRPAADEASFADLGFDPPHETQAAGAHALGSLDESFADLGFDPPAETTAVAPTMSGSVETQPAEDVHAPFASRDGVWARESPSAPGQRRGRAGPLVHRGSLADGALFGMLNAAHQSGFSGDLRLIEGEARKTLSFDHGRVQRATSNLEEERFGAFCVRSGALEQAQLERAIELAAQEKLKTGEALLQLGLLTPDSRNELLARQVKEILWSTFTWERGTFELVPRKEPRADAEPLSLSTAALVMEGLAREAQLEGLLRALPLETRLTPTSDPPYELGELQLGGPQAHVLAHSDGSKRITDLLALTDLGERELLATLHGLVKLGILEPRAPEPASRRITFGL